MSTRIYEWSSSPATAYVFMELTVVAVLIGNEVTLSLGSAAAGRRVDTRT
jgi:hypothetical protein